MTTISHDQRCRCPIPTPSGRVYLRRHHCLRCDGFLLAGMGERRQLELQAAKADAVEGSIWPTSNVPIVTVEQAESIVREELEACPELTQPELAYAVSLRGRYEKSDKHFYWIVRRVRDSLGIIPTRGRERVA